MANKEFFARHGLVVNSSVLVANISTGNVGIGTTSTAGFTNNALAVFGTTTHQGNLYITNSSTISGIVFSDGTFLNTAGAGGGGWGAPGGPSSTPGPYPGGSGGYAITLNGYTATRNGSGTTYGTVA